MASQQPINSSSTCASAAPALTHGSFLFFILRQLRKAYSNFVAFRIPSRSKVFENIGGDMQVLYKLQSPDSRNLKDLPRDELTRFIKFNVENTDSKSLKFSESSDESDDVDNRQEIL
jgi:hypothetical protein